MKLKKNWVKIVLFVLGVVILAVAAYICLPKILQLLGFLVRLFLPFLLGYLFSMAVNPLADTLQKRLKIPRGLSAVLVIVLIVGIFGSVLTFAIWKIVDEGRMLYTQFPTIYENIQNSTKALGEKWSVVYMNLPSNIQQAITSAGETVSSKAAEFINMKSTPMVDYAGNFAKALPSVFIGIVVFILSSYFMVSENKTVMSTVQGVFSPKFVDRLNLIKTELKKYLGGYIKAQGILMCIAFAIMFIGFIPILELTSFGSVKCRISATAAYITIRPTPSLILPFKNEISDHGHKTRPLPKNGNASKNAIPNAIRSAYSISSILSPINIIANAIHISIPCALI